ncbi:hypothetical protein CK203_014610 [Vitis vinifera]|uniref:Uncharacterized protein n=1 Tax=Vitis vinifera TaxID=29760 RepID=A0A438K4W8_VITVI|nr:hypothetical protein CK203_014610 [Vitis vinifera]
MFPDSYGTIQIFYHVYLLILMQESLSPKRVDGLPTIMNETRVHRANRDACSIEVQKGGRTRSLVANWEKREISPTYEGHTSSNFSGLFLHLTCSHLVRFQSPCFSSENQESSVFFHKEVMESPKPCLNKPSDKRGYTPSTEKEAVPASDEDAITDIMEQHGQFVGSIQSRLSKLQGRCGYAESGFGITERWRSASGQTLRSDALSPGAMDDMFGAMDDAFGAMDDMLMEASSP